MSRKRKCLIIFITIALMLQGAIPTLYANNDVTTVSGSETEGETGQPSTGNTETTDVKVEEITTSFEDEKLYSSLLLVLTDKTLVSKDDATKTIVMKNNIVSLSLPSKKITNVSGLEKLTNIETLNLYDNEITDITPIGKMQRLRSLTISKNKITNITPLKNVTVLNNVVASDNTIEDISILGQMQSLRKLTFNNNKISDISAIKNLTDVIKLEIGNNNLDSADLKNISTLTNILYLNISKVKIKNLDCISTLTKLKKLTAIDNEIEDISVLENLKDLEDINLSRNKISDITPISNLEKVTSLYLAVNEIKDITPIQNYNIITKLSLAVNQIVDVSVIEKLTNLEELYLQFNYIKSLPNLEECTKIKTSEVNYQNILEYVAGVQGETKEIRTPNIILQALDSNGAYYSEKALELNNCKFSSDKKYIIVNPYDAVYNTPYIAINSGKLQGSVIFVSSVTVEYVTIENGTKLDIEKYNLDINADGKVNESDYNIFNSYITEKKEPESKQLKIINKLDFNYDFEIDEKDLKIYSDYLAENINFKKYTLVNDTTTKTDKNIIARFLTNNGNLDIKDNNYEFTQNGTHTFKYLNENGEYGSITAKVDFIDKEELTYQVKLSTEDSTNGTVEVTVEANKKLSDIYSNSEITEFRNWTLSEDKMSITRTFNKNTDTKVNIQDLVGNKQEVKISVNNIVQKTVESESLLLKLDNKNGEDYIFGTWTNKNVYIKPIETTLEDGRTLTTTYKINEEEESSQEMTIDKSGIYEITATTKDKAGNSTENLYVIKIDKEIDEPATLVMRYKNASGERYSSDKVTEENIYIEIENGEDALSGIEKETYTINSENETSESTTLTASGNYQIKVTTEDKAGNTAEKIYYVYIDKEKSSVNVQQQTNEDGTVTVKIVSEKTLKPINGWNLSNDKLELTKIYTENAQDILNIQEESGRTNTVFVDVTSVRKIRLELNVNYSTKEMTNDNVTVSIVSNKELNTITGWTLSTDKKTLSKIYTENKQETLNVTSNSGETETIVISVYNIDKEGPSGNIVYSTKQATSGNVTVTITSIEEVQPVTGWTLSADKKVLTKTYTQNTTEKVQLLDLVGNKSETTITVNNIDKTAPTITVKNSTTQETTGSVTVTITANEQIQKLNGWTLSENQKTLTKTYTENTSEKIQISDLLGNTTQAVINVQNIIKEENFKTTYTVEENYITKILPNTTLEEFKSEFNVPVTINTDTDIVKTGMEVIIQNKTYKLAVLGDLNGDGKISQIDLVQIKQHIINMQDRVLTNEKLKAADLNDDGKVSLIDLVRIKQIIIGMRKI